MTKLYDMYVGGEPGGFDEPKPSQDKINEEILKNQIIIMKVFLSNMNQNNNNGRNLLKRIQETEKIITRIQ